MDFWTTLLEIVLLLAVATLTGTILERFGQRAIIAYLLTGILLGPSLFGVVKSVEVLRYLAELGVALLLFTIGLEFSWRRLREFGVRSLIEGLIQIVLTAGVASLLSFTFGYPWVEALVLGAAVSLSSTAIVLRVLSDRTELESLYGRSSLGILLVQDLAVVPLILMVSALGPQEEAARSASQFTASVLQGIGAALALLILGKYLLPRLLQMASVYRNRDLPVLIAITFCLGSTWLSHALGLSPILGAFVSGMLLAETPFAEQIRIEISPLQAGFVTLFFTSVGTLATISLGSLPQALLFAALIVSGKAVIVAIALMISGRSLGTALAAGLVLAQIGEFSFVLTELGFRLGLIDEDTLQMLISSSVITLAVTPFLISIAPTMKQAVDSRLGHSGPRSNGEGIPPGRLIVVGYGPSGRATFEHLSTMRLPCVIIELNPLTVTQHQPAVPIHYGDATREEVLLHLGVESARAVVITIPDPVTCREIIRQTKRIAPGVCVIARCRYHRHAASLLTAGADHIVDEESIIGSNIARRISELIEERP